MLVFLDTEFSGKDQMAPELISIGLISEDGLHRFYAELQEGVEWHRDTCEAWVKRHVLSILTGPELPRATIGARIWSLLEDCGPGAQLACDWPADFQYLLDLIEGVLPDNVCRDVYNLRPLLTNHHFGEARAKFHESPAKPLHHALFDAEGLRMGWLAWSKWNTGDCQM